jgi:hypothetical protein
MQPEQTSQASRTALQDSNNGSPGSSGKNSPVANASVTVAELRGGLLWLLVGILVAFTWVEYSEKRVLVMRIEGFERALIAHGIKDTYPHLPGEND